MKDVENVPDGIACDTETEEHCARSALGRIATARETRVKVAENVSGGTACDAVTEEDYV